MSGKISKTKHNVVKNIIKALEEENMGGAINIVRKVYPIGGITNQQKANPFSRTQLRKRYWKEIIAPQLKKDKFNAFVELEIKWKLMQENFIEWAKTMGVKIGS